MNNKTTVMNNLTINGFIELKGQMKKGAFASLDLNAKKMLYNALMPENFKAVRNKTIEARRLKEKQEFEAKINAEIEKNGAFYMVHFSRDCDMVEVTRAVKFNTVEDFYEYQEDAYEAAEGPNSFELVSYSEGEDFNTVTRDRIMENFENGGNGFFL
jgi:hypothetical protein